MLLYIFNCLLDILQNEFVILCIIKNSIKQFTYLQNKTKISDNIFLILNQFLNLNF